MNVDYEVTVILISFVLLLSGSCIFYMLLKFLKEPPCIDNFKSQLTFCLIGVFSSIADTIGLGSYSVSLALCKTLKVVKDEELLGLINGAQLIPGTVSAILFLSYFYVDFLTLSVLILGATLGGIAGAIYASRIKLSILRVTMILVFSFVVILLSINTLDMSFISGGKTALLGVDLFLGFIGLFTGGFLSCLGVGLFPIVQSVLFLLGMSPLVAFPIMTAAGAIQQPVTTFIFIRNKKVPLKKALVIGISGLIGVGIGFSLVNYMNAKEIHLMLVLVMIYNIIILCRSHLRFQRRNIGNNNLSVAFDGVN